MAGRPGASKYHSPEERFWVRVNISDDPKNCWEWAGSKTRYGYGEMKIGKKAHYRVHRFCWELHHGPIPKGMFICHHCDNPSCVNPEHLFLGTPLDNVQDKMRKGRHRIASFPRPSGESHYKATLTWEQVREIRSLYTSSQNTLTELATMFDISIQSIFGIVNWLSWRTDNSPPRNRIGRTCLTKNQVRSIRAEYATGTVLQKELAEKYHVGEGHISNIVNYKVWKTID